MGNPNLKAEYAHNIEFTIDKLFGNSTMLSFFSSAEFINNAIEKVTTIDNNSISTTTYENIDKRELLCKSLIVYEPITKNYNR